jgi:hypothetical protein
MDRGQRSGERTEEKGERAEERGQMTDLEEWREDR